MELILAGNPNSGKTTLFNAITKKHEHVGNLSGVTVGVKRGVVNKNRDVTIVDLPGAYSFLAMSDDERNAVNEILNGTANGIIAVVDGTHLKRSIPFINELILTGKPITLAVNFCDELAKSGIEYDFNELSNRVGIPIVPISAKKGIGLKELISISTANKTTAKRRIEDSDFDFSTKKTKAQRLTERIDKILLGKYTSLLCLFAVLFLSLYLSNKIGGFFSDILSGLFERLIIKTDAWLKNLAPSWARSLLIDGILSGVFSVITFLPQILITFLFVSIYEFTGYTVRIVFILDRLFRWAGLSGKTSVSLLSSCGCTVNGVLATRIIENDTERKRSILTTAFMPCGAKLVVLQWVANRFFAFPSLIVALTYAVVLLTVLVTGYIMKKFSVFGDSLGDLLIEMPTYRMPTFTDVYVILKEKVIKFLTKAGTYIVAVSIVLWFLSSFNFYLEYGEENSILYSIGKIVTFIFYPLGFVSEEVGIAIITGLFMREAIIPTLTFSVSPFLSPLSAFGFCIFICLYPPCLSALFVTRGEIGKKGLFKVVLLQFLTAYAVALIFSTIGIIFY